MPIYGRTPINTERGFPKSGDKNLFPRSIDIRFGRFATFPVKKVFFVNQILSGLGETASLGITGVPYTALYHLIQNFFKGLTATPDIGSRNNFPGPP